MRVHEHRAGKSVQTHEVAPETRLNQVLVVEADERAYLLDGVEEVDVELTVAEVFGEGSGHVVVHRCRTVTVAVAYGGVEKRFEERPSTRLREVRRQAAEAFGIAPADASGTELRLPDSTVDLNLAEPVGALTPVDECEVMLDLVHAQRPQG